MYVWEAVWEYNASTRQEKELQSVTDLFQSQTTCGTSPRQQSWDRWLPVSVTHGLLKGPCMKISPSSSWPSIIRICISTKFQHDVPTAGMRTTQWEALVWSHLCFIQHHLEGRHRRPSSLASSWLYTQTQTFTLRSIGTFHKIHI